MSNSVIFLQCGKLQPSGITLVKLRIFSSAQLYPCISRLTQTDTFLPPCGFYFFCGFTSGVAPHSPPPSGHPHGMVNGQKSLELCSNSLDGRQPSPLTSPLLNDACSIRTDDEDEVRRKVCKLSSQTFKASKNFIPGLLCIFALSVFPCALKQYP